MKVGSEDGGDSCSTQRLSITPFPALGSSMTLLNALRAAYELGAVTPSRRITQYICNL